jgi:hypothetical protein
MRTIRLAPLLLMLACALPTKPVDERLLGEWVSGQVELSIYEDRTIISVDKSGEWRGQWARDRADVLTALFYSLDGEQLNSPEVITAPYRFEGDVLVWGTRPYQRMNK